MHPRLFGTSGVRKKISELTPSFAADLGAALGSCSKSKTIPIGRDTRTSGLLLGNAFASGLLATGHDVLDLGIVPTPTVGVATSDHGTGVMVTASHNPPDYNGFKFWSRRGAFTRSMEEKIEKMFHGRKFKYVNWKSIGSTDSANYVDRHIELIREYVGELDKPVKVLLDCAGGAGSVLTPKLLTELGCEVVVVNNNLDGIFPHGLEPTEENAREACKLVRKHKADIGFVHDGDADRAAAVGRDGRMIEWDTFLTILAYDHKRVVTTVDASMRVEEIKGRVYRVPVGDVAVVDGIRKKKASFGGEPSGTFIYPGAHIFPDGPLTVAVAVKLASEGRFYDLVEGIPSYPMTRLKIPCREELKQKVMANLSKVVKGRVDRTDGVRIKQRDGWVLIRPSGTESIMRITAEAVNKKKLAALVSQGREWIKQAMK